MRLYYVLFLKFPETLQAVLQVKWLFFFYVMPLELTVRQIIAQK